MANRVVIDIEARLVDKVSSGARTIGDAMSKIEKSADKAKKKLNDLDKTKSKPDVSVDDNKFIKAIDKAQKKLNKLGKTRASAMLGTVDKASRRIIDTTNKAKNFAKSYTAKLGISPGNALQNLGKVSNGLEKLTKKTWGVLVKVKDMALAPIKAIKNALFSIPTLITAVVSAKVVQKAVLEPINLADAYSGAKIGFATLLGDTQAADMMNQLDEFAKATPFKTSGVIDNAQKMMSMGWNAEDVIKDMKIIGDAAASTGKGDMGFESIVRALSQIKTKGKLSTEELNQLAEAGIAAKALLAEGLGYGTGDSGIAKMTQDLEKGLIQSDTAIQALLEGMKKFEGTMERTANETVEGLKSQLEDTFEINILRKWGQGLQDGAKRGLGSIVTLLDGADDALESLGDTVYELGKKLSNLAADKLENTIKRITDITGSYEFKEASLGEKFKMLWKGVISDPLSEWWNNGGREKTAEAANKIGKSMGEFLSTAIKGLLGITDIFTESGMSESGGMSIGQSFAKGFVDGFDVSGVTEKLKEAISNVWNSLPWWGKMLVGGYIGGKAISGIGGFINNAAPILSPVAGAASGGLAALGYKLTGAGVAGTTIGGISGGLAAGAGLGAVASGVGAWYAGKQFTNSYQSYKAGDKTAAKASFARGAGTTVGIGAGALAGAKIGAGVGTLAGPVGTAVGGLIGAGLGTVVGWFAGDKIARNIEAAKFESEEMRDAIKDGEKSADELAQTFAKGVWENQKRHFGDIKLSLSEIERLSSQIVFGDKIKGFDDFAAATQQAKASYESMVASSGTMEKWFWKAGLGVKFNDDEKDSFKASVEEYINSAKSYVENKHYEFTTAVSLLVDVESKSGKSIVDSGNAYYGKMQKELESLGKEMGDKLTEALEDGIINADEQKAISAAQKKIAEITNKISQAETTAEFDLIKLKFGGGQITSESFANMQSQIQTNIDDRISKMDDAFTASVASIRLQYEDGALSKDEANKQIEELAKGYKAQIKDLKAEVKNVQLEIVADAYSEVLGKDGVKTLNDALTKALKEGIDPKTWTLEEAKKLLGVNSLTEETAGAIGEYLGSIADQIEGLSVDGKLNVNLEVESKTEGIDMIAQAFKNALDKKIQSKYEKEITVVINGQKEIREKLGLEPSEFGIPEKLAKTLGINLTGKKIIDGHVILTAKDFGIEESYAYKPQLNINPNPIVGRVNLRMSTFGINSAYSFSPRVNVSPVFNTLGSFTPPIKQFRGGVVEGFSNGGYVKGGGRLIKVAEEGDPEVIIPLSSRRRDRAMDLWRQTGSMLNVPGFATGGFGIGSKEPVKLGSVAGEKSISINIGGIELNVKVEGGQDVVEAIQSQKEQLANEIAGIIEKAISEQYQNMPAKKGA